MFQKFLSLLVIVSSTYALAQSATPVRPRASSKEVSPAVLTSSPKDAKSRKFALDVVNSAVALPQTDQQDRLRVLSSAVEVMAPLEAKKATELTKEGIRIESELIAAGQKPAASLFTSGQVDCKTAVDFAQ